MEDAAMTTHSYRDSASFGKRQEYVAVAELLKWGFDVYMTLVDDQQIDCVIRGGQPAAPSYIDVQIKARSKTCKPSNRGRFAALEVAHPRPNFFFIFYSEDAETYWVMPSLDLVKQANSNKGGKDGKGKHKGKLSIVFANYSEKQKRAVPRPRFDAWKGGFELLKDALVTRPDGQRR